MIPKPPDIKRAEFNELWSQVREHFGPDHFRSNGIAVEVTPKGVPVLHVSGLTIFRDQISGKAIAARVRGAAVQYAQLESNGDGQFDWDDPVGHPRYN